MHVSLYEIGFDEPLYCSRINVFIILVAKLFTFPALGAIISAHLFRRCRGRCKVTDSANETRFKLPWRKISLAKIDQRLAAVTRVASMANSPFALCPRNTEPPFFISRKCLLYFSPPHHTHFYIFSTKPAKTPLSFFSSQRTEFLHKAKNPFFCLKSLGSFSFVCVV
jgi:hypothetical protein